MTSRPLFHPHYRPDIDGLRAFAVLAVVLFHAFPDWMPSGFIGVDVFFVISGFLISSILFASLEQGRFSLAAFYVRRVRRIFPALLTVMGCALGFGWFALAPDEYEQLGRHVLGGATFLSNVLLYKESGYFDLAAETKPLLHLWSLAIEEQFYIFWPLLLAGVWKFRWRLFPISIVLLIASLWLNVWLIQKNPSATFYFPLSRFWELLAGGVLAYWRLHHPQPSRYAAQYSWLGLAAFALGLLLINKSVLFPGAWAMLPVLAAVCWLAAGMHAPFNRHVLAHKGLVGIGLISYPLYLWHWPLLSFLHLLGGDKPAAAWRLLAVLAAVVLAWLTYRFIERPLRFGKSRFITPMLLILMVLLGYTGYADQQARGWLTRLQPAQTQHWQQFMQYPHLPFHNAACDQRYPQFQGINTCLLSQNRPAEVAIVGDSHSNQYYNSLAAQLPQHSVLNLGAFGCFPFVGEALLAKSDCRNLQQTLLKQLTAESKLHTIYLVGHWSFLAAGQFAESGNGWRLPAPLSPAAAQAFQTNGRAMLRALTQSGKQVIVLHDLPDMDFDIKACFDFRPPTLHFAPKTPCAISRPAYLARTAAYRTALQSVLDDFPRVPTFDPAARLCDTEHCWAARNGEAWYFNGDHLNRVGADAVVQRLLADFPPHAP